MRVHGERGLRPRLLVVDPYAARRQATVDLLQVILVVQWVCAFTLVVVRFIWLIVGVAPLLHVCFASVDCSLQAARRKFLPSAVRS